MTSERVVLHFKSTCKISPRDGQECLVFNPCDGYRVAEWYEPGNCFLEHDQTLSPDLAILWMELPELVEPKGSEASMLSVIPASVIQISLMN